MIIIRRRILFHLIVIHIFTKFTCSQFCGNRCCANFYQSSNRDCLECPLGTYGKNCTGTCVEGFYGRFCQSECTCPAEICDVRYGCSKEYTGENEESKTEWINVTYALIGAISTMSLIGLLLYFKSWFSKTSTSSTFTNQVHTDQTENQDEHGYESRRSSSFSEDETTPQRTQNHPDLNNYTDLRFSQIQPLYDNSKESVPESEAPSVDFIPSQRTINDHNEEVKEDDNGPDPEKEYARSFKHEEYNVLSLRKPSIEKTMTLRSIDSSTNLDDNIDGMEDGYDSIEMNEKNKEECSHEIRKIKSELAEKEVCRKSSIDETIQEYIESAQLNRKLDMTVDNDANALKTILKSKSFTAREFDRPKRFSSRPYSLANSILRKHPTSGMSKLSRISDYEEVSLLQADNENEVDELKCPDSNTQSNTESFSDQTTATPSDENENKKSPMYSDPKDECQQVYEEIDSFKDESHKYTKEKNESFEPNPSYEYSQVQKRPQLRFNDSSTLSIELLSEEGEITTKM